MLYVAQDDIGHVVRMGWSFQKHTLAPLVNGCHE